MLSSLFAAFASHDLLSAAFRIFSVWSWGG